MRLIFSFLAKAALAALLISFSTWGFGQTQSSTNTTSNNQLSTGSSTGSSQISNSIGTSGNIGVILTR